MSEVGQQPNNQVLQETGRYHALSADEAGARLQTDFQTGLKTDEVQRRQARYGPNELVETRQVPAHQLIIRQFASTLILILVAAAAVSIAIGQTVDAIVILSIVVANGLLGFVQEWRAERALAALQQMLSPQCRVVRDGSEQALDTRFLVPGDIVLLEIGDRVPADIRVIESVNLKTDESALTGESVSVGKIPEPVAEEEPLAGRRSMCWMGTTVTDGLARGVVAATGMETEFGRIANLTQTVEREPTPLQRRLGVLGRQVGIFAIAISAFVAVAGWLLGKPVEEMFLMGVSLAVAVVPEGLPAVVTITLALGIHAMVRRNALIRRLPAAETLGAATFICTDKTGTLTQNEMTVTRIWMAAGEVQTTGIGYDPAGHFEANGQRVDYRSHGDLLALLETGMTCNHARLPKDSEGWHPIGDPTEAALIVAAYKAWLSHDGEAPPTSEFSFNSTRKRMTIVEHREGGLVAHVKGAPEVILERCSHIREERKHVQ